MLAIFYKTSRIVIKGLVQLCWRNDCYLYRLKKKAHLQVQLPLVQQLSQVVFQECAEVLVLDRVAGCLHFAQQRVVLTPHLKNGQIFLHQLLK